MCLSKRKLAGVVLASLIIGGCDPSPTPQNSPSPAPPQEQVGRYAIIHSPQTEQDVMLLDTATGNTWQLVRYSDEKGHPLGWEPASRLVVEGGLVTKFTPEQWAAAQGDLILDKPQPTGHNNGN